MGIHDGHRSRVKRRFLESGLDGFDEHTKLELLLFYSIPRSDVNPLAHSLISKFGSISGVFDAPLEELMAVKGVSENTATLIKLVPQMARQYMISKASFEDILVTTEKAGAFLVPFFVGERDETVYMVCMDAKKKVLSCKRLFTGSPNISLLSVRKIVENALTYNATYVIIAHNHPSGIALPSREDIDTTIRIREALAGVDVELVDHIIVADEDFVSVADSGFLDTRAR